MAEHQRAGIKLAASQLWYSSTFCCAGIVVLQFFFSQISFKKEVVQMILVT